MRLQDERSVAEDAARQAKREGRRAATRAALHEQQLAVRASNIPRHRLLSHALGGRRRNGLAARTYHRNVRLSIHHATSASAHARCAVQGHAKGMQ